MENEAFVHVIDDDEAVRQSLAFLLTSDGLPVRLYASAEACLAALCDNASGCIVTDVRMPDMNGIDLLRRLVGEGSTLPVIVMTGHADVPLAVEAMREGAMDFIEKPFDDDVFLTSIRRALAKNASVAELAQQDARLMERLEALTQRERQVLDGLVAGKQNKVIAYELGISPRTVEIYRANVMTKLKAKSLSDLVRMAIRGWGDASSISGTR